MVAVRARQRGMSAQAAADLVGVGRRSVSRWHQRVVESEDLQDRPRAGRRPKLGSEHQTALIAQVQLASDATLAEHCDRWFATTGVRVSTATMSRALARAGWTRKKRRR